MDVAAAHAVPLLRMRHMYGGLRDPSRHAQRQQRDTIGEAALGAEKLSKHELM